MTRIVASWRGPGAAVAVAVLVVLAAACSDPPDGSDQVSDAVGRLADGSGDAAEVVTLVAADGIADDDAATTLDHLPAVLDDVAASVASDGSITRPDTVSFIAALVDQQGAEAVSEAVAAWLVTLVAPHVDAPSRHDVEGALAPAVHVVAAATDGADEAGEGSGFENDVTAEARRALALLVVDATGQPAPPDAGGAVELLSTHFDGDPIEIIDLRASVQAERLGPDDDWPSPG